MARGCLIVVEGLDRSGKSTQCERLIRRLEAQGSSAVLQKFPDRTTVIGGMINDYLTSRADLDDRAIHLLFSANRWECASSLVKLLEAGTHVILDRYVYSGIAFSVIKGLDRTWCRSCDAGLPAPDLILFLNVGEEIAAKRGGFGEERYEKAELQKKVRSEFFRLFEDDDAVKIIDAEQEMDRVSDNIWSHVESKISGPLASQLGRIGQR